MNEKIAKFRHKFRNSTGFKKILQAQMQELRQFAEKFRYENSEDKKEQ